MIDLSFIFFKQSSLLFIVMPFIICAVAALAYRLAWQKRIAAILDKGASRKLLRHFSLGKSLVKALLLTFALLSLAFALARPQWDEKKEKVVQEGRDVLIALDISRSMLAQDVEPSRLEAAKSKIKELVNRFGVERVCLMTFSGMPFIQCPFTQDIGAFLTFLDMVEVEPFSSGTTAIDKALAKAVETFNSMPSHKHKIVIIVTDGEDFSSLAKEAEKNLQEKKLRIFTLGVGTPEGAPIPLIDSEGKKQGHVKHTVPGEKTESIVITRLNESLLKKLAMQTHGRYVRITADDSDINQLLADVNRFDKERFDDTMVMSQQEKYGIFATVSFIALILEWIL